MNKWQWKVFSITTILALALALCPLATVSAAPEDGNITGTIAISQTGAQFNVEAFPVGGGDGYCNSSNIGGFVNYVAEVAGPPVIPAHYEYKLTGCDSEKDYTVVANGWGYTFNSVTVDHTAFGGVPLTAAAPEITPVDRVFSGHVYKPNGDAWVGFVLSYKLDAVGETDPLLTTAPTGVDGVFTIPGVTDASQIYIPRQEDVNPALDGYNFMDGDRWVNPPLRRDTFDWDYETRGTRYIHGRIESMSSVQGCRTGASVVVTVTDFSRAYTNDPAAGSNIILNMTNTSGFKVGEFVVVSSSAGSEVAAIGTVTTNISITVATLALNHTNAGQVIASAALPQSTTTNSNGNFNLNNLEPLDTYIVTPSKAGCVYTPASQTIDITNGGLDQDIVFQIPDTGVYGMVKSTLGDSTGTNYASLAYYLIATYTTSDGVSYSTSVNWANGSYQISVPPNANGTLSISRVGGPAAFGYEPAGATRTGITITDDWSEQNFTLVPTRIISGTLVGPNGVPVQKDATVDFGYWLNWKQPGTLTTYSLKAQPKLYYLSPVENGITGSTPVRFLANLTTAASVTTANFTFNLKTYLLEGCLHNYDGGNESLILPAASVRFRPAAGYGTTTIPATLSADNEGRPCGLNNVYYSLMLPKGMVGNLEADNHSLDGNTIDGITNDRWEDYYLFGNRLITGRVYNFPRDLNLNFNASNFNGGGLLVLRDAATNAIVNRRGNMEVSREFSIPMLESRVYTLSIQDRIQGYDVNPFPMFGSRIVTVNLATADVDIPGASGFMLTHKPINPASATGGGYFVAAGATQAVQWAWPEQNQNDRITGFEQQIGTAITPFTDTVPAPWFFQTNDPPAYTFTGLTAGTLYRWRVRAVYEDTSKGPWLETAPLPTSPVNWSYLTGAAANIAFTWNAVAPVGGSPALKYVVQYSDTPAFTASTTLTAVTATTTATTTAPTAGKTYYWRVKVQNSAGVDISGWSPIQVLFNRYQPITAGPTFFADTYPDWWGPKPSIRFFAANSNASLPTDAYYQVQVTLATNPGWPDWNVWTFTRTPNLATPSARQFLDSLPVGDYKWQIRIVNGNDSNANPITDWALGTGNITR